jgi:dTDP-4-dehydrorhamnose 3,5-epimerase
MELLETPLEDVVLIEPTALDDREHGLTEYWNEQAFADLGLHLHFVQDNHVQSHQGVLRGLHCQTRHPQGKLLRVVVGEAFNVAVDLRRSSPTFGRWHGELLSAENGKTLWVPEGFAVGFYVTSPGADLLFRVTEHHEPSSEFTLLWNDPDVGIAWPLVDGREPILSRRDRNGVSFRDAPKLP